MEEEESWGTFPNLQHFGGKRVCWSSGMGLGWIHKWEFKMISTCTTKKKGRLVQVKWKWCDELTKDNLKHKTSHSLQPLGGGTIPLIIVYSMPLCGDYIQMSLFLGTPKWESQNQDFCCPKTLDVYVFLKSSLFWKCEDNIL
jgi:hypothetical protein